MYLGQKEPAVRTFKGKSPSRTIAVRFNLINFSLPSPISQAIYNISPPVCCYVCRAFCAPFILPSLCSLLNAFEFPCFSLCDLPVQTIWISFCPEPASRKLRNTHFTAVISSGMFQPSVSLSGLFSCNSVCIVSCDPQRTIGLEYQTTKSFYCYGSESMNTNFHE